MNKYNEQFFLFFNLNPVATTIAIRSDGRIAYANDAFLQLFFLTRENVTGKTAVEMKLINPEARAILRAHLEKNNMSLKGYNARLTDGNGKIKDFILSSEGAEFDNENYIITTYVDITERVESETRLKELSDKLYLATSTSVVGIWEYDVLKNTLVWDDSMFILYGVTQEMFLGVYDAWRSGLHPEDTARGDREIQMALSGEKEFDTEFRVVWPDGSIRHIKAKALVQRDSNGKAIRMLGTNWDITGQKKSEEKLSQLAAIIDSSDDAIISKRMDDTILTWNNGAEKILGYRFEEVRGKNISLLFPPELNGEEKVLMGRLIRGEVIQQYETVRLRKNQTKINVSITLSPIKDSKGNIIAVSKILRDITKIKQQEDQQRKYAILEAKSKEMEQFTYIASHDLRHPLLTILNYIKVFDEDYSDKLDNEAKYCLRSISEAAGRMDKLILGLLEYSRLSKIKELETVNCNEIIQSVLADLNSTIRSTKAKIIVHDLPILSAYPIELRQLFQNLITNALKFKKSNTLPELVISAKKDNDGYRFAFHDNGIGIKATDIEKLFLIFQRLHTTEEYEGTGLGLAYCKKIVEHHRGRIWVESKPDQGSSFYFTINT